MRPATLKVIFTFVSSATNQLPWQHLTVVPSYTIK